MLQPHPACACGGDKHVLGDAGLAYAEICGGRGRDSCLICVLRDLLRLPKALYVALLNALDARLSTSFSEKTLLDVYRTRLWTHSSAGTGEATTVCK